MTLVKIGVSTNRMSDYTPMTYEGSWKRFCFDGGHINARLQPWRRHCRASRRQLQAMEWTPPAVRHHGAISKAAS